MRKDIKKMEVKKAVKYYFPNIKKQSKETQESLIRHIKDFLIGGEK